MEQNMASIAVKIDHETITKTVERIVLQEIASKLGDPGQYFDRVIKSCVYQKVDSQGRQSNSSYDTTSLIEYLAFNAVKESIKSIVELWMSKNKKSLQVAIEKELKSKIAPMAKIMADVACQKAHW